MNHSRAAVAVSKVLGIVQMTVGYTIVIFFGLIAIYAMFDDVKDGAGIIIFTWVIVLMGVAFIMAGMKRRRSVKEFRRYVAVLSADPGGSIDSLAASVDAPVNVVRKNLDYMIRKNYFVNAFIDENTNCIIIGGDKAAASAGPGGGPARAEKSADLIAVTCKNCGGINKIQKGKAGECEYCGSAITAVQTAGR